MVLLFFALALQVAENVIRVPVGILVLDMLCTDF